jgi:hypothetical protein
MNSSLWERVRNVWERHHALIKTYLICIPLLRSSDPNAGWFGWLLFPAFAIVGTFILWLLLELIGQVLVNGLDREKAKEELPLWGKILALTIVCSLALAAHQSWVDTYLGRTVECMKDETNRDWDASDSQSVIGALESCVYNARDYFAF